jgi:hypothetical protein
LKKPVYCGIRLRIVFNAPKSKLQITNYKSAINVVN